MARIFYSMAGEGRGHAARARAMVECLRPDHELTLFAPGDAYELLAPVYGGTEVRVFRIPGLRFHYTPTQSLDPVRTIREGFAYLWRLRRLIGRLKRSLREDGADLVITDFEPALARAAEEVGVPYVSLDHQHFLVVNDLSDLPWELRWKARLMGLFVRLYCRRPVETIVSQFYAPPLRPEFAHVQQVGVLLRPEVLSARPQAGRHILAYLRREMTANVLDSLEQLETPVRVYGLGTRPSRGLVEFLPVSQQAFIDDLAAASVVVSTAGNQLVGEALFFRKPVLALPETNNFEQRINAHYLAAEGCGDWADPETLTVERLRAFLARSNEFIARIDPTKVAGNAPALAAIQKHLPLPSIDDGQLQGREANGRHPVPVLTGGDDIERELELEELQSVYVG
jgi:uncharacterized protein (TIGR00661 family)